MSLLEWGVQDYIPEVLAPEEMSTGADLASISSWFSSAVLDNVLPLDPGRPGSLEGDVASEVAVITSWSKSAWYPETSKDKL